MFQSTPPRGGRPVRIVNKIRMSSFNPRPRAGGDAFFAFKFVTQWRFQSTPPRGGRPMPTSLRQWTTAFQSTPPRGGRQFDGACGIVLDVVSIHAPARGATPIAFGMQAIYKFQSTPPRGGRRNSIRIYRQNNGFQSTPPRGGRLKRMKSEIHIYEFQSTPPRGGRRPGRCLCAFGTCFNPRPRAGGDKIRVINIIIDTIVSIHAPARGATLRLTINAPKSRFQSTPPRGGRHNTA